VQRASRSHVHPGAASIRRLEHGFQRRRRLENSIGRDRELALPERRLGEIIEIAAEMIVGRVLDERLDFAVVPAFEGTIGLKSCLLVRDREMLLSGSRALDACAMDDAIASSAASAAPAATSDRPIMSLTQARKSPILALPPA
jgi:hypothetical protein